MVKADPRRTGIPVAVAAAAVVALVCYLNTFSNQFVFDDIDVITANPLVRTAPPDVRAIFTTHYWHHLTPTGDLYRPLVILSYAINHAIGGMNPGGFHAVNLLLHALCAGLVVILGARLGLSVPGALAAGVLFAAHPIHTEAVAGLVGRAELMAAGAVLAAWIVHLGPAGIVRTAEVWRTTGVRRTAAIAALLLAGLLSKENAIVLPGLMLAGDLARVRRNETTWRALMPAYAACAVVILIWLGCRATLLSPPAPGSGYEGPFAGVGAMTRVLTALSVMARYLLLLVRPTVLSADYSFEQIPLVSSAADPLACTGALILLALTLAVVRGVWLGREPVLPALSIAVFLISIAPVSNLLVPIGTIMGERLLYLPSVGFCLLGPALWGAVTGPSQRNAARAAGAVLVCVLAMLYAARTITRNADWKDQLTLFSVTSVTSPSSAKVRYNLGVALEDAGRPEEALREYLAAVSIKPLDAKSHLNAGLLLGKMDRAAEASMHLDQASRIDGSLPHVFTSLGAALTRLGNNEKAAAAFAEAVRRDPDDAIAHYNFGTLRLMMGDPVGSIPHLEKARVLNPDEPDGRFQLGLAYLQAGRARDAIPELSRSLELSPGLTLAHLQLAQAYLRLGMRQEAGMQASLASRAGLELPPELQQLR